MIYNYIVHAIYLLVVCCVGFTLKIILLLYNTLYNGGYYIAHKLREYLG